MVEKGLKKGAVFSDGGSFYMVDEVVGENYISHRITKEDAEKAESEKEEYENEEKDYGESVDEESNEESETVEAEANPSLKKHAGREVKRGK